MNNGRTSLAGIVIAFLCGTAFAFGLAGSCSGLGRTVRTDTLERIEQVRDTVVIRDTVVDSNPRTLVRYEVERVYVPADTVLVREQSVYTDDSTYTAWVSGVDAVLDSIDTYARIVCIRDSVTLWREYHTSGIQAPSRWNIGVGAGVGAGIERNGTVRMMPVVALTLNCNIFSFRRKTRVR